MFGTSGIWQVAEGARGPSRRVVEVKKIMALHRKLRADG
jgi:hypothetical protein